MDLSDKQKIVKLVGSAELVLTRLESLQNPAKEDRQLLKSIKRSLNLLKLKPFAGDPVANKLWPKEFYHLPNLFRIELSQFWRLLYYVIGDETRIIVVVFEICDHEKYNKIFNYGKK